MTQQKKEQTQNSILIVEDNPEELKTLTDMLTMFDVRRTTLGEEAISMAQRLQPSLILLGLNMTDLDGYQVCQKLKADTSTQSIPILFIGDGNEFDMDKAFDKGAVDYFNKPFQTREVMARVNNQFALIEKNQLLIEEEKKRKRIELELKRLANSDGLTGAFTRQVFDKHLINEWKRCSRNQFPLSVVLCDIDCFKDYNETYGYIEGDQCLVKVAQSLFKWAKRPGDLIARYDRDMFVILLPETHLEGAQNVALSILKNIQELSIPHESSSVDKILTLSVGISSAIANTNFSMEQMMQTAEKGLKKAKEGGRNQMYFFEGTIEDMQMDTIASE